MTIVNHLSCFFSKIRKIVILLSKPSLQLCLCEVINVYAFDQFLALTNICIGVCVYVYCTFPWRNSLGYGTCSNESATILFSGCNRNVRVCLLVVCQCLIYSHFLFTFFFPVCVFPRCYLRGFIWNPGTCYFSCIFW